MILIILYGMKTSSMVHFLIISIYELVLYELKKLFEDVFSNDERKTSSMMPF